MIQRWDGIESRPPAGRIGPAGWARVVLRGGTLGLLTYTCLLLLLLTRLLERPVFGLNRPITPHITQFVCKSAFVILGMKHTTRGTPMTGRGAIVANHASWLDIFALNATQRVYFVAKSEVATWPGIGWLAHATGTVFIARKGSEALAQRDLFEARLRAGHRLLFFPEGTSTDGLRVLPFKSTLFAAFYSAGLDEILQIQPVSVVYQAPAGQDARFYGWWGDMDFGRHLLQVLAAPRQGGVEIIFHAPIRVGDINGRKELAIASEDAVRAGHNAAQLPLASVEVADTAQR